MMSSTTRYRAAIELTWEQAIRRAYEAGAAEMRSDPRSFVNRLVDPLRRYGWVEVTHLLDDPERERVRLLVEGPGLTALSPSLTGDPTYIAGAEPVRIPLDDLEAILAELPPAEPEALLGYATTLALANELAARLGNPPPLRVLGDDDAPSDPVDLDDVGGLLRIAQDLVLGLEENPALGGYRTIDA